MKSLFKQFTNAALLLLVLLSCVDHQKKTFPKESGLSEKEGTVEKLPVVFPVLGDTPDISTDAKDNLKRLKRLYEKIDSLIATYPDYASAKQHLSERQIALYENEAAYAREDHLDVSEWGCSWYCGGGPDSIFASSVLQPQQNFDYRPENIHDFSLRTAWIEGSSGNGKGEQIGFLFPKQSAPVTVVKIYNGYMKSERAWKDNARVKRLRLSVNGKPCMILALSDTTALQMFAIDTLWPVTGDRLITFEILDVYPGDKFEDAAISELTFDGFGVHCFAKGTLVLTPQRAVPIEQLAPGDVVMSYNEQTRSTEPATILETASQQHHHLYMLNFSNGSILSTDDHPFYDGSCFRSLRPGNLYGIQTEELRTGDEVLFFDKGIVRREKLLTVRKTNRCEETYTIVRLSRNRLFFAGNICVATEALPLSASK